MKLAKFKVAVGKHQPGQVAEVTDEMFERLLKLGYAADASSLSARRK